MVSARTGGATALCGRLPSLLRRPVHRSASAAPPAASDAQIFVLNGLLPGNETACARLGVVPVINSLDQWQQWAGAAKAAGRTLPAVLQFDTGMSRLGLPPRSATCSPVG